MRLSELCLYRFCLLICLFCASYMTYFQFQYYLNDEDSASISYRQFNKEEKDEYPAFSICLKGNKGRIFKRSHDAFKSINISRGSYYRYLRGFLPKHLEEFHDIKFSDVVLDITKDVLIKSYESYREWGKINGNKDLMWMLPGFQSYHKSCISKNILYRQNVMQEDDHIILNSSIIYGNGGYLNIYVHQHGRSLRSGKKVGSIRPKERKKVNGSIRKYIDIGLVDILRRRSKGKNPCDQDMKDEDEYILDKVMRNVGCIPTFWAKFAEGIKLNQTIRMCNSTADYQKTRSQLKRIVYSFDTENSMYKHPCTEMMTATTSTDAIREDNPGTFEIRISYRELLYREIINNKAYSSETLLSQVGGLVGMLYPLIIVQNTLKLLKM